MLTPPEMIKTKKELQENYSRLGADKEDVLRDLNIDEQELDRVLNLRHPDPGHVWMVRDYLEDKLTEAGIAMYPFSKLSDHAENRWYDYDTPWRE